MAHTGLWTVDGVDVWTRARFSVERIDGLEKWPGRGISLLGVLGADKQVVANSRRMISPRRLVVHGSIDARGSTLTTRMDALADLLLRDAIVNVFPARRSGVAYTGYLDGENGISIPAPQFRQGVAFFDIPIVCPNPYGIESSATTVTDSGDPVTIACNIGTGPVRPMITLTGPATGPIILTHKDHDDATVLGTMEFDLSLADASEYIRIDCEEEEAWKDVGAGEVSAMDDLEVGYTFPVLRPEYGDRNGSDYQTLGANVEDIEAVYNKAWA